MKQFFLLFLFLFLIPLQLFAAASVVGSGVGTSTGDGVSHSINLPATTATNGILVILASDGVPTIGIDTGASGVDWVQSTTAVNGSIVSGLYFWKASSSGSDVLTVTTSATERVTALAYEITGHGSTLIATSANGSSANSDPPNLTGLDSGVAYVVFATRQGDAAVAPTVGPSTYATNDAGFDTQSGGSGANTVTSASFKAISGATSEDPGAWTSASEQWVAWTIAIPEAGGTPTPTPTATPFLHLLSALGAGT